MSDIDNKTLLHNFLKCCTRELYRLYSKAGAFKPEGGKSSTENRDPLDFFTLYSLIASNFRKKINKIPL